ncbi:MAG: hypothetical protein K6L81_11045 [Agarilytica sp.]
MGKTLGVCIIFFVSSIAYSNEYSNFQLECLLTTADLNPNIHVDQKEDCTFITCSGFGIRDKADAIKACKSTFQEMGSGPGGICSLDQNKDYSLVSVNLKGNNYSALFKQCKI